MKVGLKRHFSVFLALLLLLCALPLTTYATEISASDTESAGSAPSVTSPSALLMDAATGTILYEKNSTEERPLASVTKIMTLLLIFQALEAGQIHFEDTVTISEHAASMGGSQVYLEPNETQTVETLIKCITVASANDACVAMAELISGSEDTFVQKMNETAASLGMTHTNFVNCCGLDADNHYSCANDIALMSRELAVNHPTVFDYTKIWQEDIIHHTARGDSAFTLSNTNHLLKQYPYATGLKTGFTSKAGFCLSATAAKDSLSLIAVVMGATSSKERIADVKSMFDWGFANCRVYTDENQDIIPDILVSRGRQSQLPLRYESAFHYLDIKNTGGELKKKLELPDHVEAPIQKDDVIGKAVYKLNGENVGSVNILAVDSIPLLTLKNAWVQIVSRFFI